MEKIAGVLGGRSSNAQTAGTLKSCQVEVENTTNESLLENQTFHGGKKVKQKKNSYSANAQ